MLGNVKVWFKGLLVGSFTLMGILYPVIIYVSLRHGFEVVVFGVLGILLLKNSWQAFAQNAHQRGFYWLGGIFILLVGVWLSHEITLKLMPVVLNFTLLLWFASTLFQGPPLIEQFARLEFKDLPSDMIHYCRRVTQVWVLFFFLQTCLCLLLAFAANNQWWLLYNTVITYSLITGLLVGEYLYRRIRFRDRVIPSPWQTFKTIAMNFRRSQVKFDSQTNH